MTQNFEEKLILFFEKWHEEFGWILTQALEKSENKQLDKEDLCREKLLMASKMT